MIIDAHNEFLNVMGTKLFPDQYEWAHTKTCGHIIYVGNIEGMEIQLWAQLDEDKTWSMLFWRLTFCWPIVYLCFKF